MTAPQLTFAFRHVLQSAGRRFALDIAFTTARQRLVVFGPSGSGKSQTLRLLAGLVTPQQGRIRLADRDWLDTERGLNLPPEQRRAGLLFQDYALFPHLTVRQNIAFGLTQGWRNPRHEAGGREVDDWLLAFELDEVARQRPADLSGGQRQRVALARTLAARPSVLLLDEPFAALDTLLRQKMRDELDRWQQQLQLPMVLISHDPEDVERFADARLVLQQGQVAEGSDAG
ncbi:ATP-binding cassette domain-containing protein [Leeia sp.]|uniref:ATP-binding cassette domain-containing protein n=1 Tax=Leeia sp. TaxID=2884678 RepID=UPI0035B1F106